jgi:hypothetical protein
MLHTRWNTFFVFLPLLFSLHLPPAISHSLSFFIFHHRPISICIERALILASVPILRRENIVSIPVGYIYALRQHCNSAPLVSISQAPLISESAPGNGQRAWSVGNTTCGYSRGWACANKATMRSVLSVQQNWVHKAIWGHGTSFPITMIEIFYFLKGELCLSLSIKCYRQPLW